MNISTKSRGDITNFLSYNLLTPSEAAEILGISKASMSNLKHRGTIRPAKITDKGQVLYLRSDILKYKMHREKETGSVPLLLSPEPMDLSKELASIQMLASHGLLAIFPAKIGATVYCIGIIDGTIVPGIIEMYTNIDSDGNGDMVIRMSDDIPDIVSITCSWHEVGRTVFLTEDQARIQILKSIAISTPDDI